jgi:hypothetical protein
VQDGMTLRRHAEAARLQFIGERFRAGHRLLIASFCNKDYMQETLLVNITEKRNGGLVKGEAFHQPPILITPRPFREGGRGEGSE